MKNNYDKVAGYYDWLSRTIFQRSIINAQVCLLPYINEHSTVLIVGGGTGWILEEIARVRPARLKISYVEISAEMIRLSQKRDYKQNNVTFIHQSIETFVFSHSYDVILTPFLFDNFSAVNAALIFDKLHAVLKAGGHWLFVDFLYDANHGKLWQRLLLKTMYGFFRLVCNIEGSQLSDMESMFRQFSYQKIFEQFFYGRFIWAAVYRK
jgi:ubiquinone/menaquinone biosynthesis C-methylase UbiE